MEMKKCIQGHYYDASIHVACPYCSNANDGSETLPLDTFSMDGSATMPFTGAVGGPVNTMGSFGSSDDGNTVSLNIAINNNDSDEGRTVALIKEDTGVDPVVGWLVCVDGTEKGRDYRIHSDNNYIGRSDRMDICLRGDETISRENHAVVSYDLVDNTFYFSPGDGRAIVRFNGKAIFNTVELKAYDTITIGKTVLTFVPLCSEKFTWEN